MTLIDLHHSHDKETYKGYGSRCVCVLYSEVSPGKHSTTEL